MTLDTTSATDVTARFAVVGATPTDDTGIGTILDDDTPLITVPGAPTLTSAIAGPANGMVVVERDPPASDGGSAVTRYDLEVDRPAGLIVDSYTSTAVTSCAGAPASPVRCGFVPSTRWVQAQGRSR